jgi:hypothetical protein
MTEPTPSERAARRRLINLGEAIAAAALIISTLGLWNSWRAKGDNAVTTVVEQRSAVPLALRGKVDGDGKALLISAVDPGHALDSLTLTVPGRTPITIGSDGRLTASDVEAVVPPATKQQRSGSVPIKIAARYIEAGKDHRGGGTYRLSYRWVGGGLFGGNSLRLTGFSRG